MTESFPLKWPISRERTPKRSRKPARFDTTPGRARDALLRELKLLGARDVVISSNVATYRRGGQNIMYANQSAAQDDPGVAIYYTWKGDQYALACDKWTTVTDNLQALNKTIEAIRGIERWGTGEMMKAAFAGFKELPEKSSAAAWYEVLGVNPDASMVAIRDAYIKKAKVVHPDSGGSEEAFNQLQVAYQKGLGKANHRMSDLRS